ncbi:hypothetical protein RAB80_015330 [Fusarium oxysporum f. sp. vasinfectum]|uniref:Uncharacterized protein n=1 Tax=Fusarium oxysporum f. sp. vasinfectum 25433 TaxID=1089449 RepID=X0KQH0_FUSOX|nr:hypothetical protein FOTG_15895 [Fusarium oxysporum f. sp. vasinfectum 25433]KAK2669804.1 hypothetical protein RAB80_015330 [Fusarium oxysporum f. sp. vasinfectum]KAK2925316.1 hypothetical protein FoTM2_015596 [Fusarium oxysporum f. sp. vasinfectum]
MSEISYTLPSGIARYVDVIPYPTQATPSTEEHFHPTPNLTGGMRNEDDAEVLAAFQISTNAAIRRLLNMVHSVVYDSKDHFRMTRREYVKWLLRVSEDFRTYQDTIFHNLPDFLLMSWPLVDESRLSFYQVSETQPPEGLRNHPWNVLRLQGRYYAAQHIIHRPFIDYLLLNMDHIESHPDRDVILRNCGLCLEGCKGFFSVFDGKEANTLTCLFATGLT